MAVTQCVPMEGTLVGKFSNLHIFTTFPRIRSRKCLNVLLWFVCDYRCWSGYSREGSGSQVHVAVEWTLPSLVNTFYGGKAKKADTLLPSSE